MDLRRFRALYEAGVSISAIARETGHDWRTVKKYLTLQQALPPVAPSRRGTQPRVVEPFVEVIDTWLRADVELKATVIHERLVADYGFTGHYQRVKMYVAEARLRIRAELGLDADALKDLHRRFEVTPGAQAQVDWGDEGGLLAHVGIEKVYSFHMVLSYSRDPFCCYTTSMDLGVFWDCHRRGFAHFGGVPASIVYDRTKTVVRRHVAPGKAVPLHPEAVAFAGHYDFDIDVLAAHRPTGKGRVERQVDIVRDHVLAGRSFDSTAECDDAFGGWVPIRRGQVHRTHGEVIGVRARRDHAALRPLPEHPYLVADRHLRRVGKDCLVSFAASVYSIPARQVRPGQTVGSSGHAGHGGHPQPDPSQQCGPRCLDAAGGPSPGHPPGQLGHRCPALGWAAGWNRTGHHRACPRPGSGVARGITARAGSSARGVIGRLDSDPRDRRPPVVGDL